MATDAEIRQQRAADRARVKQAQTDGVRRPENPDHARGWSTPGAPATSGYVELPESERVDAKKMGGKVDTGAPAKKYGINEID